MSFVTSTRSRTKGGVMPTLADGFYLLLEELENMDQPADVKTEFRTLILRKLNDALTEPEQRVQYARHLLGQRVPRSVIRERLQTRFRVERSQAYRDIDQALQTVP